jgi:hypothetical protein
MSKIALTPNATGTGVFTISSPATNTDRTLTLPDETGTVLTSASSLASDNLTGTVTVSGGNVGIGTSSPAHLVDAISTTGSAAARFGTTYNTGSNDGTVIISNGGSGDAMLRFDYEGSNTDRARIGVTASDQNLQFFTAGNNERCRIDSSGNVLVGMTTASTDNNGVGLRADGLIHGKRADVVANFNRQTTDGTIVEFAKDNTVVGVIGSQGTSLYIQADGDRAGLTFGGADVVPRKNNANSDNAVDLGHPSYRYKVVYAGTGSINTSDRNEKQDIDVMSEAETRVAVACKSLMRKFRFIDAVEAKGDDARIHFGIIAQDLQDAFAAEGLDASRYAMFCSNTWWEADRVVPAVEAVDATLDDEGNQITEAVVAVAEHTVIDHYDTLEKAPEGATERTRLGVRYSELLAFIIGAL